MKKKNIKALLAEMTLAEKIGQLTLTGSYHESTEQLIKEGRLGSLLNVSGYEHIRQIQEMALSTRLGIPLLFGDDVIHGFRTIFPIPLAEACSWNMPMIEEDAHLAKLEASESGINWIYAPMLDITHDPRWGRIMETSGEDPYYGSLVARAKVRGIQHPLANGNVVAACAKHYLGYGAVEAGLDYNTTEFSEHRMRTLYLPPFKAAVDEGVLSVMNAFTTYDATPVTTNRYLLRDVLRGECRFDGLLVSDWACIEQVPKHGTAKNLMGAALQSLLAGIDIDMHSDTYLKTLEAIIEKDPSVMSLIDEAVLRILRVKEKMGLFEHPFAPEPQNLTLSPKMRKAARYAAGQSVILLKNNNRMLPVDPQKTHLVVGSYIGDKDIHIGAWANKGKATDVVSIQEGFQEAGMNAIYYKAEENGAFDVKTLAALAEKADDIIVALGEPRSYSGENNCRQFLDLPFNQDFLVNYLAKLNKPLIAIVLAGRPLTIANLEEKADSILWCWHLGVEAGNAIADVLKGAVNPSARTVITFPKTLGQVPLYYNQYRTGRRELEHYVDGDLEPLYPFGYGLNYGDIRYDDFRMEYVSKTHHLNLLVRLSNESPVVTEEVIQAYLSVRHYHSLRPKQELCGFRKVSLDKSGLVEEQISIDLNGFFTEEDFRQGLVLDISVGPSSRDVITHELVISEEK